jgi:Dynamin GTPase effector domain
MMSEREDVAAKRKECQEAVEGLSQALHALEALPSALLHGISSRPGANG